MTRWILAVTALTVTLTTHAHAQYGTSYPGYAPQQQSAAVEDSLRKGERDVEALERDVRRATGRFVNERTRRRPMIVPVVMET